MRASSGLPRDVILIGFGAYAGNSYRADGSVVQTDHVRDYLRTRRYRDRETPPIIERVRTRTGQFEPSPGVDWAIAGQIIDRLVALQKAGIEVVAFLPPFSTETDAALREDRCCFPLVMRNIAASFAMARIEAAAGLLCLADVPSPKTYGLTDDYMIDGFSSE